MQAEHSSDPALAGAPEVQSTGDDQFDTPDPIALAQNSSVGRAIRSLTAKHAINFSIEESVRGHKAIRRMPCLSGIGLRNVEKS